MNLGLVLSGGGIKGAAHIGVLKALEEENIRVTSISGTSSGSIVAALYSCGYSPNEIYYIFKKYCRCITDYDKMIPFKVLNTLFTGNIKLKSLAKGDNLEYIVESMCYQAGIRDISQMPMPCVIPAVDIVTGKVIYFTSSLSRRLNSTEFDDIPEYINEGKISNIVRASTAFPGVFAPKRIGEYLLVDGGVRVNSPVSALKNITNDEEKIMVIYFEKIDNNNEPKNLIDTTIKSFDIMGHQINQKEIELADYRIDIESRNVSLLDISKLDYMVNLGYRLTRMYIKNNLL